MTSAIRCFAVIFALAMTTAPVRADDPEGGAKTENKLVGTWKLVSAKYGGKEFKFPEGSTMLKHVTPTQFMWATYAQDGKGTRDAGGGDTLTREGAEATPETGT